MRYYTPDEKGVTRAERNSGLEDDVPEAVTPPLIIPRSGRYLWDWYFDLSERLRRIRDGICEPIPPSEFMAHRAMTREIVYPSEYAILCAIDVAYCAGMNTELSDYRAREAAQAEADRANAKANKGK